MKLRTPCFLLTPLALALARLASCHLSVLSSAGNWKALASAQFRDDDMVALLQHVILCL